MSYVITQSCCNDASCIAVCPVNCIHPGPGESGFMSTEMLYIDPQVCIDCGACVEVCPVDAIRPETELGEEDARYLSLNAQYYARLPAGDAPAAAPAPDRRNVDGLRVAIVGSGPAAHYAAEEILRHRGAQVEMYERLLTPYGLIRAGVAPDHPGTKAITERFRRTAGGAGFHLHLGVEIGRHLSHAELLATHSAVLYATGAAEDRRLGIPGEDLPGSHAATEFVGWYNGHPDHAGAGFDLSGERAVIVGNGNVALDVARILLADPAALARTDIAGHALAALKRSNIREVILLGRRGPAQAAYTTPELYALLHLPGVDVVIDPAQARLDPGTEALVAGNTLAPSVRFKADLAREIAARPGTGADKRIVFRYLVSPLEIFGPAKVSGIRTVRNSLIFDADGTGHAVAGDETETLEAGLILRSVGYRGSAVPGVPFDQRRAVIPNHNGRVTNPDDGTALPGVYTSGWIKRGPGGVIGTNRVCAQETVGLLLEDFAAGVIAPAAADRGSLEELIRRRNPEALDLQDWAWIDDAERRAGVERGTPRVKFDPDAMLDLVRARS